MSVLRITRPGVLGLENKDTGDVSGDIFFAVFEVLLEGNFGSGFLPYVLLSLPSQNCVCVCVCVCVCGRIFHALSRITLWFLCIEQQR